MVHRLAGKPAPRSKLVNVPRLVSSYYINRLRGKVEFGTSGHRGSSLEGTFNEKHIASTAQAICDYRKENKISGPLFMGKDTHALSEPAFRTALEIFSANGVEVVIQAKDGYTPTPAISYAILAHNKGRKSRLADGVVITPSHNPPRDGGFKYNPTHGGPAGTEVTKWIEDRANLYLRTTIERVPYEKAVQSRTTHKHDFVRPYVEDLGNVIDMEAIKAAGLRIGADPMGGAGVAYWAPIAEEYGLNIKVVNKEVDPTFSFMTLDKDGKIRMDCSSPYAMASLIGLKDKYDVAFGNDTDFDRHGIVVPSVGLMNPNHYLSVAIDYLFRNRTEWRKDAMVGKTLVSSSMIDRVAAGMRIKLSEVPVGFKWFVDGLLDGSYGFGGEESAGASFLRKDGSVWVTEKDGIILDLLAAEITARTDRDPGEYYQQLTERFGTPIYDRIDEPASKQQKDALKALSPEQVTAKELAGERILAKLTRAPGNNAAIGGLKVVTTNGWFAARPSGTEDKYKIYAESFKGQEHFEAVQAEAKAIVAAAFKAAGV